MSITATFLLCYLDRKIMSVFLLPERSTVAVIQTLVMTRRLVFDLASGVNCLRGGGQAVNTLR